MTIASPRREGARCSKRNARTVTPAVATIGPTGKLLAIDEGTVHVQVVDDLGAVAVSGDIAVCSMGLPPLVSSIGASETVLVPVTVSRSLDGLDIVKRHTHKTTDQGFKTCLDLAASSG